MGRLTSFASLAAVALLSVAAFGAAACTQAADKQPLVLCEDGTDCSELTGSKKDKDKESSSKDDSSSDGTLESPTPSTPAPETDSGTTPPTTELGPECTALKECCAALLAAGITGSAKQCDKVVLDGNEISCMSVHEDYKTPDEYYDPVCQ